jgi:hypothetical protein
LKLGSGWRMMCVEFQRGEQVMSSEIRFALDPEARKDIFRKVAGTAIENSHAAIKQVWVVLFAAGTYVLIKSFDDLMGCMKSPTDACNSSTFLKDNLVHWKVWLSVPTLDFVLLISLYIIYVLTFYRFYVGNIRVFDIRYIEIGKFVTLIAEKLEAKLKKLEKDKCKDTTAAQNDVIKERDGLYGSFFEYNEGRSRFGDSIFLIFKTLTIVSLTIEINNPTAFMTIYGVVLVLDLGWMVGNKLLDKVDARWKDAVKLWNERGWRATWGVFAMTFSSVKSRFRRRGSSEASPVAVTPKEKLCRAWRGLWHGEWFVDKNQFFRKLFLGVLGREEDDDKLEHLEEIFTSHAIKNWGAYNFRCMLLLLLILTALYLCPTLWGLLQADRHILYWLGALVMFSNCVADLGWTWKFYNPTFKDAHDLLPLQKPESA